VAFLPRTNVTQLFHRIRQLRNTAVRRRQRSIDAIKGFLIDAILIAEGLRDGPRARQLRHINNALISEDGDAILNAISVPFYHFQTADEYELPLLPACPRFVHFIDRIMFFYGRHIHHVVRDEHATYYDSRPSRSRNRADLPFPRPRGRSASPQRGVPASLRFRDDDFCYLQSFHRFVPAHILLNVDSILARLAPSDIHDCSLGNSDGDGLIGYYDTDKIDEEHEEDDESDNSEDDEDIPE
jgi:hypothetical protein